jgi:predicted metal-dependent peptidase
MATGASLDPRKLAAARLYAASKLPYLATALFALPVSPRAGAGTIGITKGWHLYADPELLDEWDTAEVGAALLHLLSHVLRDHAERAAEARIDSSRAPDWLLAADVEVNDDLRDAGVLGEAAPDLPIHIGAPDGLLAEAYMPYAVEHMRRGRIDCGSGADDRPRPMEDGGGPENEERLGEGPGAQSRRLVQRAVAEGIQRAIGDDPGSVPAGWVRWADELLAPRVDWRRELATMIRRAVASVAGAVDYSYRKPSRRAPQGSRVLLPSLHRPVPEIAIVCDTSASMGEELLARSLAEVEGILTSVGAGRGLRILACDAAVHSVQRVAKAGQVALAGGGGTNMGEGIAAALTLRPRPGIVVVLTDGSTPWPATAPRGTKVVIGLLEQGKGREYATPPWARPVRIPKDELVAPKKS